MHLNQQMQISIQTGTKRDLLEEAETQGERWVGVMAGWLNFFFWPQLLMKYWCKFKSIDTVLEGNQAWNAPNLSYSYKMGMPCATWPNLVIEFTVWVGSKLEHGTWWENHDDCNMLISSHQILRLDGILLLITLIPTSVKGVMESSHCKCCNSVG